MFTQIGKGMAYIGIVIAGFMILAGIFIASTGLTPDAIVIILSLVGASFSLVLGSTVLGILAEISERSNSSLTD